MPLLSLCLRANNAPGGTDNVNPLAYHVLHQGRRIGPYDRRTIVGLRIKKTLTSLHELEASDGTRLTVAELLGRTPRSSNFNSMQSGAYSSAQFTCSASLIDTERGPVDIPAFVGELEVRVHADVLRIAGKHRRLFGSSDSRIRLPLTTIVHARATGSRLDLWLHSGVAAVAAGSLQRLALDLFSAETARELLRSLPDAKPWPATPAGPAAPAPVAAVSPLLWAVVFGLATVAGLVLLVLLRRQS